MKLANTRGLRTTSVEVWAFERTAGGAAVHACADTETDLRQEGSILAWATLPAEPKNGVSVWKTAIGANFSTFASRCVIWYEVRYRCGCQVMVITGIFMRTPTRELQWLREFSILTGQVRDSSPCKCQ